jgi:hypothetical protein
MQTECLTNLIASEASSVDGIATEFTVDSQEHFGDLGIHVFTNSCHPNILL